MDPLFVKGIGLGTVATIVSVVIYWTMIERHAVKDFRLHVAEAMTFFSGMGVGALTILALIFGAYYLMHLHLKGLPPPQ